jgi:hypothetical protein
METLVVPGIRNANDKSRPLLRRRVSVRLVAGDGESLLAGAIESVSGLADEVVVVDTGRTAEVSAAGRLGIRPAWPGAAADVAFSTGRGSVFRRGRVYRRICGKLYLYGKGYRMLRKTLHHLKVRRATASPGQRRCPHGCTYWPVTGALSA